MLKPEQKQKKMEKAEKKSLKRKWSRDVDEGLLDLFWKLADTKQDVRITAALAMIRILKQKQTSLEEGKKSSELEYTVDRLVKGMASPRQCSRQAFSCVLSEILRQFLQVEIEDVLKLTEKHLSIDKEEDKSQVVIGCLLTYNSIIISGRLVNSPSISTITIKLFSLANNRSYVQEATYKLFINLFSQISEEHFKDNVWPHLKKELQFGWEKAMPDNMWLLLLVIRSFPSSVSAKFLRKHFDDENLLTDSALEHWKIIIKKSCAIHPNFHPVCSEFIKYSMSRKMLTTIWNQIVDEVLFETDQCEKTFLGFAFVKEVLSKSRKKKQFRACLSPKLFNILSRNYLTLHFKLPLHTASVELVDFFSNFMKSADPQIQMMILKFMAQMPLDKILKRKEFATMVSNLQAESVKEFCELLKGIVFQVVPETQYQSKEMFAKYSCPAYLKEVGAAASMARSSQAVHEIGILLSHPAVATDDEWRIETLKFLCLHSYFVVADFTESLPECEILTECFSATLRNAFQDSFNRALDSFNRRTESSTSLQNLAEVLKLLVSYIDQLLSIEELRPLFDREMIQEPWSLVKKISHRLKKKMKKGKSQDGSDAFQMLVHQLGLQLLQETKRVASTLEELETCCRRAGVFKKSQDESDQEMEEEEGPPWIDVLIDILLSLLSQQSHHMRCVVNSVFSLACPFITDGSLQLILDVINPSSESAESALVNESDEEEQHEEEMDFDSGSSSSAHSDDDNEEGDDDVVKDNDEFKLKLQKVLNSTDLPDDDDDSDAIVTDSEMFKIDEALSEVFRSRKKKKKDGQQEEKILVDFKVRCLDLIAMYIKSDPPLETSLRCIKPIMSASEFSKEGKHKVNFTSKALTVLKTISKSGNLVITSGADQSQLVDIMTYSINRLHNEANVKVRNLLYSLCSFISLTERKLLAKIQNISVEKVKVEDLKCFNKYFEVLDVSNKQSSSQVVAQMFTTVMNSCPEYSWLFLEPLEKYAFNEKVRLFRRSMCLGLILPAIKYSKGQKSISKEMWLQFTNSIVPKLIQSLKQMVEDKNTIKPMFMSEVMAILVTLHSTIKEKFSMTVIPHNPELVKLLSSKKCRKLPNKTNKLRRRVVVLFGGDPTATFTNDSEMLEDDEDKELIEDDEDVEMVEDDDDDEEKKEEVELQNLEEKVNGDGNISTDDFNEDSDGDDE